MSGHRFIITEGDKFGFVTVLNELPVRINASGKHERMVRVRCECGEVRDMFMWNMIKRKAYVSCGCKQDRGKNFYKHGLSGHPLHGVWCGMIGRCYHTYDEHYDDYGGRGILVCNEWKDDFKVFYDWALENGWERGLEIDRYPDNDGHYEPSNCRFATEKQNCNNRRNNTRHEYNGELLTISEIADLTGVTYSQLASRIKRTKMTANEAVEYIKSGKRKPLSARPNSKMTICRNSGVNCSSVYSRMRQSKETFQEAFNHFLK